MRKKTTGLVVLAAVATLVGCGGDEVTSTSALPSATAIVATATEVPPQPTLTRPPATATATAVPTAPPPSPTQPAPTATSTQVATATETLVPNATPTATTGTALLAPPPPEEGFQLTMSGFEVPASGETEVCQLFYLPNDGPIDVDRFEVAMPEGSHHFVVWTYNGAHAEQYPPGLFHATACLVSRPDDSMNVGMLIGSGTPRAAVAYSAGIGVKLAAHQPVLLNSHYTNPTSQSLHPTVYVNVYYAKTPVVHPLESLAAGNYKIFVPPGESRTTRARFTVPFDSYYLSLSSHMHKRGDVFAARLVSGDVDPLGRVTTVEGDAYAFQTGRRPAAGDFYRSQDWANPTVIVYDEPRLFPQGSVVEFDCTQHNDKSVPLGFGPLADDEMCILTGGYYRADTAPPPGSRVPGCLPQANQLTCYAEPAAPVAPGPPVCGNGQREAGEQCDLGADNGVGACRADCTLSLSPGATLGTRVFPIVFSGPNGGATDFVNSVTRSSAVDPSTGAAISGSLQLRGGKLAANGSVRVAQEGEARIGLSSLGGGSICIRIGASASAGTLYCLGGTGVDLSSQLDNLHLDAQPTQAMIDTSLGADGGPGSAFLLLPTSIATIAGGPSDCLTRDWSADTLFPLPFTTGTSTGTITNADGIAGSTLIMSSTGENFDCARWTDDDGPGVLQALAFLSPNSSAGYSGDVIAQLTLAGHEPAPPPPPSPTPTATTGTPIGGEFAAIADDIFAPHCALPSCHSSTSQSGSLVLERSVAYDQLVGVTADNPTAKAAGVLRVAAGDPDASFLLRKLRGDLSVPEGSRMPLNSAPLSAEDIERIRAWIAAGAEPGV